MAKADTTMRLQEMREEIDIDLEGSQRYWHPSARLDSFEPK